MLRHNVALNGLDEHIDCRQVAVARRAGAIEMVVAPDKGHSEVRTPSGRQGFGGLHRPDRCHPVTVDCLPLDQLTLEAGFLPSEVALVWSDTQGFEGDVIDSGATLWREGVPLWVEVWPDGLQAHGGVEHFVASCVRYFRQFILDESLPNKTRPASVQPVTGLARVIQDLTSGKRGRPGCDTDVLLIP
jgi:FkbM family methyltransferase